MSALTKTPDLSVEIAGVSLKNPVMPASGTFGSGMEYAKYLDLSRLGAVVTKGVSKDPWPGNATPRVTEVPGGMLNAIGLQNPGMDVFIERDLAFLKELSVPVIVNVVGKTVEEYLAVAERLSEEDAVSLLEINVSCPNVKEGAIAFGQDPAILEDLTRQLKRVSQKPLIIKLSPNVTDITTIAKAAEAGGADALSLINTLTGMKIDVEKQKFVLANKTGGMSGPAVHPVAVRMVYQTAQVTDLPIIGMGGVTDAETALEMLLAGATAVAVGSYHFHDPAVCLGIIDGIQEYLTRHGLSSVRDLVGAVRE